MPRWYEEDDTYLSQRFPTFFEGDPYEDLYDTGPMSRRNARIGPARRVPIFEDVPQRNPRVAPEEPSWLDRIGGFMRQGSVPMEDTGRPGPPRPRGNYPNVTSPQLVTRDEPPPQQRSIYGDNPITAIPNAMRIAMENARTNSNAPGRPPVFHAGGVTNPRSSMIRPDAGYDLSTRFRPQDYPAASRIASAQRRVPSDVPVGPPPGGITAPEASPIQMGPGARNPYEPVGDTGWTRNAPNPFLGQEGPAGMGAWNRFDITQQGGRNAGAEGNFPGTVRPTEQDIRQGPGFESRNQGPDERSGPQYNWSPTEEYTRYLENEPDRSQYKPKGWSRILNAASAGVHGYQTGDIGKAVQLGQALNDRPYDDAVEAWKRRGTGLARRVEQEDKRYNIASQDYNRRVDNARQMQELNLRRDQHLLQDREFQQKVGMDNWKKLTEGWQKAPGPNGTMVLYRMGPNGMEQEETALPNADLTAAETRAENLANRQATRANAELAARTSTANTGAQIASREREGAASRSHQTTENILDRAATIQRADAARGVTGGADYTTPVKLLSSPDYREIEQNGLIKVIGDPDNQGRYKIQYKYEDENDVMKELEKLSGGNSTKFRRLSERYRQFQEYMAGLGGQ